MSSPKDNFLNWVFGSKNVLLSDSNNNTIHVGDQNIYFDLLNEKLKTKCPKCGEAADEDSAEENEIYKSFFCQSCGNTYYEYDEIARNVSNYLDLNGQQSIEFERLISAVNHDLKVGFLEKAFQRCLDHKETYGNTPQIYEWGALTLFLTTDADRLIKTSCRQVIAYLDKAREIDRDGQSNSYDNIASSIATRYFQIIYSKIEWLHQNKEISWEPGEDSETLEGNMKRRKSILRLLFELTTCYRISQDTDFIIAGIKELYGYNDLAWFERKWISFLRKPSAVPDGYRRCLKGYVWDYHTLISNCDEYFAEEKMLPSRLAIVFEDILLENGFHNELSEIRAGHPLQSPVSAKAKLFLIASVTYSLLLVAIVLLFYYQLAWIGILLIVAFFFFTYLDSRSDSKNIDRFRRVIDLDQEGKYGLILQDIREESNIDGQLAKLKDKFKIKR